MSTRTQTPGPSGPIGPAGGVFDTGATFPNPTPLADDVVDTDQIVDHAVTSDKLAVTAVTPGTYGNATNVAQVAIGADGRVTSATNVPITLPATQWSLATAPGSPSIYDDEFTSTTLNGKWTPRSNPAGGTLSAGTASLLVTQSAGTAVYDLVTRPSWNLIQCCSDTKVYSIDQSISLTSNPNCVITCSATISARNAAFGSGDGYYGFAIYAVGTTHVVELNWNLTGTITFLVDGGSVGGINWPSGGHGNSPAFPAQGAIVKTGTTYQGFVSFGGYAGWTYVGSGTQATACDTCSLVASNSSASAPGNLVAAFDYIRFALNGSGTNYLPGGG